MGMDPSSPYLKPFCIFICLVGLLTVLGSSSDLTTLVFKGCADQEFQDPTGAYGQTLKALFQTLVSQSSTTKFYKTTEGQGQSAIVGLFQCRGDLSNADCNSCVSQIPDMSQQLCGSTTAARVQLNGCLLRYEVVGFRQVSGTELLYNVCGSTQVAGSGFEDRLNTALGQIDKGVASGNGFYTGEYESVFVLGQCEGDLGSGDCVDCVKSAEDRAKSKCGTSISGQIYLQTCYISYTYYPNGVPDDSSVPSSSSSGSGHNTQRTVAIVLGGLVGFGLLIAGLLFLKSLFKKRDSGKWGG